MIARYLKNTSKVDLIVSSTGMLITSTLPFMDSKFKRESTKTKVTVSAVFGMVGFFIYPSLPALIPIFYYGNKLNDSESDHHDIFG